MTAAVTLDALGKDGQSLLPDLQGASPTGGLVRSGSVPHTGLLPGQVMRHMGAWAVLLTVCHYGVQGFSYVELADAEGRVHRRTLVVGQSVEVREDVLVDPVTLYKLTLTPAG
jgi:hypothetical protein